MIKQVVVYQASKAKSKVISTDQALFSGSPFSCCQLPKKVLSKENIHYYILLKTCTSKYTQASSAKKRLVHIGIVKAINHTPLPCTYSPYFFSYALTLHMSQARNGEENVLLDITYDLQLHKVTSDGLCVDLTLISPCIPLLYVLDLKDPFILARIVNGSEAQVRSVSVASDGQNVQVVMSDPRNLQRKEEKH